MDFKLRTPNSELITIFQRRSSLDEILSQFTLNEPSAPSKKILFWGEGAGEISSYVAGWLASKETDVILLDGANRFDPYLVSTFARKALIPPERLLKSIRLARAFTCYQMTTLIDKRLVSLLRQEKEIARPQRPWVILLGPITTFLDEDVPEREVRPLFERSLRKMEEMVREGIPFLFFQSLELNPPFPPFVRGGRRRPEPDYVPGRVGGFKDSKRAYLTKRLFQFSHWVWRICVEGGWPQVVLEKGLAADNKTFFPPPLTGEGVGGGEHGFLPPHLRPLPCLPQAGARGEEII